MKVQSLARTLLVLLTGWFAVAACTTPSTEVLVTLDTDAPPTRLSSVHVRVFGDAIHDADSASLVTLHATDASSPSLPSSFAVIPAPGHAHDGPVVITVDADFAPLHPGDPVTHVQRTARLRFVPNSTLRVGLFLTLLCGARQTGCSSVAAAQCTASIRCAEMPGQTCGDDGTCVAQQVDPATLLDGGHTVRCDGGSSRCGSHCVSILADPANCGGCGNACEAGDTCIGGVCTAGTCTTGRSMCGAICIDLQTSVSNCGACGMACPVPTGGAAMCTGGRCAASCPTGQMSCAGACIDTSTDPSNCGSCGHVCPASSGGAANCIASVCGSGCSASQTACAGACRSLMTDAMNCGACGHVCAAPIGGSASCSAGACGGMCPAGQTLCGATCLDLRTNPSNCGTCGMVCAAPAGGSTACVGGACMPSCPPGEVVCSGICRNLQTATDNCGACGHMCSIPQAIPTCVSGTCQIASCNPGYEDQDGNVANGCETQGLQLSSYTFHYRMLDTRAGAMTPITRGSPLGALTATTFTAIDPGGGIPLFCNGFSGTITAINPASAGFLTVYPASDASPPGTSTLNFSAGQISSAAFFAPNGFKIATNANVDVIIDVSAMYNLPGAIAATFYYYHPLAYPVRVVDSRAMGGAISAGTSRLVQVGGLSISGITLPNNVHGITGSITAIGSAGSGFATVYNADESRPITSQINFGAGQNITNGITVLSSNSATSQVQVFASQTMNFALDLTGYWSDTRDDVNGSGTVLYPLSTPIRLLDTRGPPAYTSITRLATAATSAPLPGHGLTYLGTTIPSQAMALIGNTTAVNAATNGFYYLLPAGSSGPGTTSLTFPAAGATSAGFTTGLSAAGQYAINSNASTDAIVDVSAYLAR